VKVAIRHHLNQVPQWQKIKTGAWRNVEQVGRDFATKNDVILVTRSKEILKLLNANGQEVEMTINCRRFNGRNSKIHLENCSLCDI
jgi:DNA/RNA endonuclease G (NUC1)